MATSKYLLTAEGLKALQEELRHLVDVRRPEIVKSLQEARAQGDLSENADYDAAKSAQGEIEGRIAEIQDILANVEIIRGSSRDAVRLGSVVKVRDLTDHSEQTFEIVGAIEADPFKNKISNECPLAKAILGKKKGDTAEVRGIESPYRVTILSVSGA